MAMISDVIVRRMPVYYRCLCDLEKAGIARVSSQQLADRMNLTASLVRQDFAVIGGEGRQGCGYPVSLLKARLEEELGLNSALKMIVIGAGNVGRAVISNPLFRQDGFDLVAIFDNDPAIVGTDVAGYTVLDTSDLADFLSLYPVEAAALTLPASAAQGVADQLISLGLKGFWNFASTDLVLPPDIRIVNVHLSDSLKTLSWQMHRKEERL